ncbi:MAG TPA: 3-methyl-2-oxobutanoate hydroxymethyltransferase [Clostridia bacterium]|nr:3-methyl-2-oxobutanoate hydroxymethyltransferase [Clostridia bacterium]
MSKNKRVTTADFRKMKAEGRPITMLTAYDYPLGRIIDEAGIDGILVGDSLGNVVLGYSSTLPVTMDDMVHHIKAVARGVSRAMLVGDMPFLSYHVSVGESVRNAGRLMQEAGATAVKLEGGEEVAESIRAIVNAGIPVMGHLGLTPQSVHQMGGYQVQGKDDLAATKLMADAKAIQDAGVYAIVLECVPAPLAKVVTDELDVPTIGIGAGPDCDGQILVTHDMLGLFSDFVPKFVKKYADLQGEMSQALQEYMNDVIEGRFPASEHSFGLESKDS